MDRHVLGRRLAPFRRGERVVQVVLSCVLLACGAGLVVYALTRYHDTSQYGHRALEVVRSMFIDAKMGSADQQRITAWQAEELLAKLSAAGGTKFGQGSCVTSVVFGVSCLLTGLFRLFLRRVTEDRA